MCVSFHPEHFHLSENVLSCLIHHMEMKTVLNDAYLHSGFWQIGAHCQSLPHDHVGIVSLLKGLLQGFQLLGCERRAASPLFAVLGAITGLQNDVLKRTAVGRQEKWPI